MMPIRTKIRITSRDCRDPLSIIVNRSGNEWPRKYAEMVNAANPNSSGYKREIFMYRPNSREQKKNKNINGEVTESPTRYIVIQSNVSSGTRIHPS